MIYIPARRNRKVFKPLVLFRAMTGSKPKGITINDGWIYYNPSVRKLFQLRKFEESSEQLVAICSGFCDYLFDTTTTIVTQRLSEKFITESIRIDTYDECDFLEVSQAGSWRVRKP